MAKQRGGFPIFVALAACAWTIATCAQTRADSGTWPPVGRLLGGQPRDVVVQGNYAYVAASGFVGVVDISSPSEPVLTGYCDLAYEVMSVAVAGQYVYAGTYGGSDCGLSVIDVSDPARPAEVGTYGTGGIAYDVAVAGGYAYVAAGALVVFGVSDPARPVEVGRWSLAGAGIQHVAISGSYAYAADLASSAVRVLDVSDPAHPTQLGACTGGSARGIAVAGGYAYLAGGTNLQVVDVSDPANPSRVGYWDGYDESFDVTVVGDHAYVADGWSGLRILLISDPAHPALISSCEIGGRAASVTVRDGYAYVADWFAGVRVMSVSDPASPVELGAWDTPTLYYGLAVADGHAFVADDATDLAVADVSNPGRPALVGNWDAQYWGDFGQSVAVDRGVAYLLGARHGSYTLHGVLSTIDVSDAVHPAKIGEWAGQPADPQRVAFAGGYAYVTAGGSLHVVDVSDPTNPIEVGACAARVRPVGVVISGQYAYIADSYKGLCVVDVQDPAHPTVVGYWDVPGGTTVAYSVAVQGSYAYLGASGLWVIDTSDPTAPVSLGYWPPVTLGTVLGVVVAGDYAYLAAGFRGLRVIGVADPGHPVEVAYWETARNVAISAQSVALGDDGYVYLGTRNFGLLAFRQFGGGGSPHAAFEYGPLTPTDQDVIQFTDTSTDSDGMIVAWEWDFGDGTTSTGQNPTHQYAAGTYTVMLTVTDNDGYPGTCSREVSVSASGEYPVADFAYAPPDPTDQDVIQFTDTSTDSDGMIVAWEWDFGDGTTSTAQNPTHQYAAGTYTVMLTVTDNDGYPGTSAQTVVVSPTNQPPVASFTYTPPNPTTAEVVLFTDTSTDPDGTIIAWEWDFGDSTTSTEQNPTHQYAVDGTYTVTLTVTDSDGLEGTAAWAVLVSSSAFSFFEDFSAFEPGNYEVRGTNSGLGTGANAGAFVLTPYLGIDVGGTDENQTGRIFRLDRVMLDRFVASFDFRIGGSPLGGADGLTFAITDSYAYPPQCGGAQDFHFDGLGWAVEVDTHYLYNDFDPRYYHIGLRSSDVSAPHIAEVQIDTPRDEDWAGGAEVWHHLQIEFASGDVAVDHDGTRILDAAIPGFAPFAGYVGLTAASGSWGDWHLVDNWGFRGFRVPPPFSDVPFTHWAEQEIEACVAAGIVTGFGDGTYRPALSVTRDQMAVFISRALAGGDGNVPTGPAVATFPDVATDHWAYRYVEYAVDQNVVGGYPDGSYRPALLVDRGQMAVFIARALVAPSGDAGVPDPPEAPTFPDVTSTNSWAWCYPHVEFIAAEGVTQGYPDGLYHPERIVSRDQMAVYVQRAFALPM